MAASDDVVGHRFYLNRCLDDRRHDSIRILRHQWLYQH